MMSVDIVCPIYKNYEQLVRLYDALNKQVDVKINRFVFPMTISEDEEIDNKIRQFIKDKNITSFEVTKEEFSHSLTREKAIKEYCKSDLVILCSQDVVFFDEHAINKLASSINEEVIYAYGRQICQNHSIERYIRKKNYPKESYVVSKDDIDKMQLMAFFASDAFSCISRKHFLELNGYQGYNVMFAEDMLYSKFILDAGYKKAYVSEAVVAHSHKYKLKQLYNRYYETGKFHKEIGLFNQYKSTDSGLKLAVYVLGQALIHFNIPVLFRWRPDMAARYLGMKKGKK